MLSSLGNGRGGRPGSGPGGTSRTRPGADAPPPRSLEIMFVLELTYTAPVERVDALLQDHVAWLDTQYAAGVFVASGPRTRATAG